MVEIRVLESSIDIEEAYLNYDDTFSVIRDFCNDVILFKSNVEELKISPAAEDAARSFLKKLDGYTNGNVSEKDLILESTKAWGCFDSMDGSDQKLIRIIICCLAGKEKYLKSVATDMQDNYLVLILVLSHRLHPKFGKEFREFIELHPAMQKYKK